MNEMLNPRVQLHGNSAVLTFNLIDRSSSQGTTEEFRWYCTEVYNRREDGWRIVHTHWPYTKPQLQ